MESSYLYPLSHYLLFPFFQRIYTLSPCAYRKRPFVASSHTVLPWFKKKTKKRLNTTKCFLKILNSLDDRR